jgi:hypothetical protein
MTAIPEGPNERRAPVQGYSAGIPWALHLEAYDAYCKKWRPQPALIEGHCRGGFHAEELDEFIPGWRERASRIAELEAALAASQQAKDAMERVEVRKESGKVDEVVGYGHFHLERMDSGHWWLGLGDADKGGVMVNLTSARAIQANVSGDAAITEQAND